MSSFTRKILSAALTASLLASPAAALSPLSPAEPTPPPVPRAATPEASPRAMPDGALLTCQSDGSYRRCQADTTGGVRLRRELSTGRCTERSTWGYDGSGVWVDKGCSGEFSVAAVGQGGGSGNPAPQPNSGDAAGSGDAGGIGTGVLLGAAGVVVAAAALAALLSGDDDERSGKDKAVKACNERADRIVQRNGGRGAKITDISNAKQRNGVVEIEAKVRARWDRGETTGRIQCAVEVKGQRRIVSFREQGLSSGS